MSVNVNSNINIPEKTALQDKRRSALKIMGNMIGLVKPLLHIMVLAILLGTAGYLCAIFLTILAGQALLQGAANGTQSLLVGTGHGILAEMTGKELFILMIVLAAARGILHYAEQYCNHFIAFKPVSYTHLTLPTIA